MTPTPNCNTVSRRRGSSKQCQAVSTRCIGDPEGRIAQRLGFGSDDLDDIKRNRCLDPESPSHGYLRSLERRSLARLGQSSGCNEWCRNFQRRCDLFAILVRLVRYRELVRISYTMRMQVATAVRGRLVRSECQGFLHVPEGVRKAG